MLEMRQQSAHSHSEVRPESGAAILGLLGASQMPHDPESMTVLRTGSDKYLERGN